MKKLNASFLIVAICVIVGTSACSSKEQTAAADPAVTTSASTAPVATNNSNLGASSSGYGR
jgi:hypothetical protein